MRIKSFPDVIAGNISRMFGVNVQPVKYAPYYMVDGVKRQAFEVVPVVSLVQRSDRGTVLVKKNGQAEVCVMPRGPAQDAYTLYLQPLGFNAVCESDAKPGVHFKWK